MRPIQKTIIVAADASADITGDAISAAFMVCGSLSVTTTGTSTGNVYIQASNEDSIGSAPTHWADVDTLTIAIAGAGEYLIPKFDAAYNYIRIIFIHTNGASGTLTARLHGFGLN